MTIDNEDFNMRLSSVLWAYTDEDEDSDIQFAKARSNLIKYIERYVKKAVEAERAALV